MESADARAKILWGHLTKRKFMYAKYLMCDREVFRKRPLSETLILRQVLRQFSALGAPFEIIFSPVRQTAVFATRAEWVESVSCLASAPEHC